VSGWGETEVLKGGAYLTYWISVGSQSFKFWGKHQCQYDFTRGRITVLKQFLKLALVPCGELVPRSCLLDGIVQFGSCFFISEIDPMVLPAFGDGDNLMRASKLG